MNISHIQAVILTGGLGTRLRSVVSDVPKSMALVNGRPFLEYQVKWLKLQGIKEFVLCTGYKSEVIESYFEDGSSWDISIVYSHEKEPLGTAGAVKNADGLLDERFLLLNGDTFCCINMVNINNYCNLSNADLVICVAKLDESRDYGNILANDQGVVVQFTEKGMLNDSNIKLQRYVNAGYYLINREILMHFPAGKKSSLEKDIFPRLLELRKKTVTFSCESFWDIGTPDRLEYFKNNLPEFFKVLD